MLLILLLLFTFANSQDCYVCSNGLSSTPCGDSTSNCCNSIPLCFQNQHNARILLAPTSLYQPYTGLGFCNITFPSNQFDTLTIQSSSLTQQAYIYCNSENPIFIFAASSNFPQINIIGIHFMGGSSLKSGGCISASADWQGLLITNCSFDTCVSSENGGAIYSEIYLYINNSTFTNNNAVSGGAIYAIYNTQILSPSNFSNNYASKDGGAIYASNSFGISTANNFNINFISNSAARNGGAIYANKAYANIDAGAVSSVQFLNNKAADGGALFVTNQSDAYVFATFSGNQASQNGGAINLDDVHFGYIIVTGDFSGNTAVNGGALYDKIAAPIQLGGAKFDSNQASNEGGAIYVGEDPFGSVYALNGNINTTFSSNTAKGVLNNVYCANESACGYCLVKSCSECILEETSFCTSGEDSHRSRCYAQALGTPSHGYCNHNGVCQWKEEKNSYEFSCHCDVGYSGYSCESIWYTTGYIAIPLVGVTLLLGLLVVILREIVRLRKKRETHEYSRLTD